MFYVTEEQELKKNLLIYKQTTRFCTVVLHYCPVLYYISLFVLHTKVKMPLWECSFKTVPDALPQHLLRVGVGDVETLADQIVRVPLKLLSRQSSIHLHLCCFCRFALLCL